ncbi:MAG: Eco57I restriction-modification methylase domain-containing protein [Promethearchaeota archaeon]
MEDKELLENFFSIYGEIKNQYASFIHHFHKKPTIHILKIDKNLPEEHYCELFSSYAADMLLANTLSGKILFSIEDFALFPKDFLTEFEKKTQKLNTYLSDFEFSLDEKSNIDNIITPKIFHTLGEYLVRKDTLDSGAVFTPLGVVKLLSMQSLIFYFQKNTKYSFEKILKMVIAPDSTVLQGLGGSEVQAIYSIMKNLRVLDPACGTGLFFFEMATILFNMYELFPSDFDKKKKSDIFCKNLFGIDINPHILFKLKFLIQIFLYKVEGGILNTQKFLNSNFLCEDSLLMESGGLKKFDIIFGNPPYVRQENIRPQGILNLREQQFLDSSYKDSIIQNIGTENDENFLINKRSDLYIYFFYYALNQLKENGVVSFLTSNSWLNIGFGFEFQDFILKKTELCSIIDFDYRAFSSAEINTVITTLSNHVIPSKNDVKNHFIKLKTSIDTNNAPDILQNLFKNKSHVENNNIAYISEHFTPQFQSRVIAQKNIIPGTRWGNELLLAPQIYFKLKEKLGSKIMKLREIATITRGITTGLNKYFILEKISEKNGILTVKNGYDHQFQIEREYLRPYLIGPKRMLNSIVHQEKIRHFLLDIPENFDENSSFHAAEYVEYGKNKEIEQTKGKNKGLSLIGAQNVPTLKKKKKFYSITIPSNSKGTQIFIQKIFSSKYKVYYSPTDSTILANNTFYNINLKPEFKEYFPIIIASLLSSIAYLSIEMNGRRSFGMGALDTATFDIENIMMIDPRQLKTAEVGDIKKCLKSISSREFLEVSDEFQMEDRNNLDKIMLDHLNLADFQQDLYDGVVNLVEQRISKSQTYKKK